MASEWQETTLGKVVRLQRGHDLPEPQRQTGDVPVMGSFGITGWHNTSIELGPGVTVGRSGASIGVVSYIDRPYWPLNTCLYVTDFLGNDPLFCYYWLKEQDLAAFNSGSAQPSLNRNYVYLKQVAFPSSIEEQRSISGVLRALDDKIELNRKMNETLEGMARALFKSWFVDFDPVRAKAEGRPTGLPDDIAALFPDSFENSELGEIPKGWKVGKFGDVAGNPRRGVRSNEIKPDTHYIALEHMPRKSIALTEWGTANGVESGKLAFNAGEILFGKLRPYFHKVGVAPIDGVCSTDIVVITPHSSDWFGFVLGHASSSEFVEHTNAGSTGTKMPRTNWGEMARYRIALPSEQTVKAFTERMRPAISRIVASTYENRTLAALRDALLPKLISGEISVKSADRMVEAAV